MTNPNPDPGTHTGVRDLTYRYVPVDPADEQEQVYRQLVEHGADLIDQAGNVIGRIEPASDDIPWTLDAVFGYGEARP